MPTALTAPRETDFIGIIVAASNPVADGSPH